MFRTRAEVSLQEVDPTLLSNTPTPKELGSEVELGDLARAAKYVQQSCYEDQ